jgi:hypothetical protein
MKLFSGRQFSRIIVPMLGAIMMAILLAGCGGSTPAAESTSTPAPAPTTASNSGSGSTGSTSPTDTPQSSSGTSGSGNSGGQASGPLIAADGTLKTAMQRVDEAEGLKYTLEYTSNVGTPDLDYGFKIDGVASGQLLPNRKSDFTLTMTSGTKGAKQNGEWIMYWDFDQNKAFFKKDGQWQAVNTSDLHDDPTNFDPMYAYNQLGDLTTFGTVDLKGKANQDLLTQIAAMYTLSGTEQLSGEAVDHYHLVGEAGGVLDLWMSKNSGDIVKFQRDVTSNGMGTIALLTLSDIGKPQTIETPK